MSLGGVAQSQSQFDSILSFVNQGFCFLKLKTSVFDHLLWVQMSNFCIFLKWTLPMAYCSGWIIFQKSNNVPVEQLFFLLSFEKWTGNVLIKVVNHFFGLKINTFDASKPDESRLLMDTTVGFIPMSELVPDVCVSLLLHRHLGLSVHSGSVAQLIFSSDITAPCSRSKPWWSRAE